MKKIELLAPVGNKESLYQAVHNGADAVYLSGKKFGARKYAQNFDLEELKSAISYCHLYGVLVYVTINTIIFDREIDEVLDFIKHLYEYHVDAVIMQDIGMIRKTKETFPDLEIHASTQMHNHNQEGIRLLESLGISRVVLSREMSLAEICEIDTTLEKEVFVHGALCACYSGCCLFSSRISSRSGNRGECMAACRLLYQLLEDGKKTGDFQYLFSMKDLNTVSFLGEILDAQIDSLKIEGRMKSPEYVGFVTKVYRQAIDSYEKGLAWQLSSEVLKNLLVLYNREYTSGYLLEKKDTTFLNFNAPNHQGIFLGTITLLTEKKIQIKLAESLTQEDGIRFVEEGKGMMVNRLYDQSGRLVSSLEKGMIAVLDNRLSITKKGAVFKTVDHNLLKKLSKINPKQIPVSIFLTLREGCETTLTLEDDEHNRVSVSNFVPQPAKTKPLTKEEVTQQIKKLGNTPFSLQNLQIDMDPSIFLPKKNLNLLRREAVESLILLRQEKRKIKEVPLCQIKKKEHNSVSSGINVYVTNEEQLRVVTEFDVDRIYVEDWSLYQKYKKYNTYYVLPRVMKKYPEYFHENLLVRELGSIFHYAKDNHLVVDYTCNIANQESVKLCLDMGAELVCLSPEVSLNESSFLEYNTEMIVFGTLELMITKTCLLKERQRNSNGCDSICTQHQYSVMDRQKRIFPLTFSHHLMSVYDHRPMDLIHDLEKIKSLVPQIRIQFFHETALEVRELLQKFRRHL